MLLHLLSFILEGIIQMIICCLGIIGNTLSIFLLLGKHVRNSFNNCIATLAIFDLIYLMTMMLETIKKLGFHHDVHVLMYPHFLHPLNSISLMCSIYMTVGKSLESFIYLDNENVSVSI